MEQQLSDDLTKALERLSGDLPKPHCDLSEANKDALVRRVGPRTARDILKAKKQLPLRRIPFLFATINTQDVVDLLANDMDAAVARALAAASRR